jgi:hypothetical protein
MNEDESVRFRTVVFADDAYGLRASAGARIPQNSAKRKQNDFMGP